MEVSLALTLAAFGLVAVLGALPTGLRAIREAKSREIAANVARRLQASVQQISFSTTATADTVDTLAATSRFYTEDGVQTADPAGADPLAPPAFFKAAFTVGDTLFNNAPASVGTSFARASTARCVTVTLWYPQSGLTPGKSRAIYSFLVARQRPD